MSQYYVSVDEECSILKGDCVEILKENQFGPFDMIFADPPYFLSNGGFSVQAGKRVSVDKGAWDRSRGREADRDFTRRWLKACRNAMADAATIWVCGTFHSVFTVADVMAELDFKMLNAVTWQKTNPPPNLSRRCLTHSTEILLWARKERRVPHFYNYDLMHRLAGGRQMTDVWRMPSIAPWEKTCGKHPTQKPLALAVRAILASTRKGALVLDPFAGSGTTGVAARLAGRRFVGIEAEEAYLAVAAQRLELLAAKRAEWAKKIPDLKASADP